MTSGAADPVGDGIAKGALIGAGAAIGMTVVTYARCNAGCEGPAAGPTYLMAAAIGAGGGSVVGWLIVEPSIAIRFGRGVSAQPRLM